MSVTLRGDYVSSERIHLSVPHMSGLEQAYVQEAFDSNWLTSVGKNLDAFEDEVGEMLGRRTLAVSSGTAALHLVLREIGVGSADRVAVSTLTFAGSVWPILYQGATPIFLDSEAASGNLDPDLVAEYLRSAARKNELPKALIVVHLYGQHADVQRIADICEPYGVIVVEDAAESLGATYRGGPTATVAPFAILSFNGNKIITTTGGGMVVAREKAAVDRMRKWATQSRDPGLGYLHTEMGYNYRMSNVLAGIGRGQLRVLEARVAARRAVFEKYRVELSDLDGVTAQKEAPWGTHSRWLSVFFVNWDQYGTTLETVISALDRDGIEVRPVWRPMHIQPMFRGAERVGGAVAETLFADGLCLPSSSSLTQASQDRVIRSLKAALRKQNDGVTLSVG